MYPVIWSATSYRELHLGHKHYEWSGEVDGGIVKQMSSLSGQDSWHTDSLYVGKSCKATALLFHSTEGLKATFEHRIH